MRFLFLTGFDEKSSDFLKTKLEDDTVIVKHAFSGEVCLSALDTQSVDAVFANLDAPRPNGLDILEYIKSQGLNVPVIVASRAFLGNAEQRQQALESGAYAALERPIVVNDLYEAVETALGVKLSGRERRRFPRLPIYLELDVSGEGAEVRIFKKTHTVDISLGGLCFEFDICDSCSGYEAGGVHPDCILRKFWAKEHTSKTLDITLRPAASSGSAVLPGVEGSAREGALKLKAKVAHIIKEKGRPVEYVGVRFVELDYGRREHLKSYLRKVADLQKG